MAYAGRELPAKQQLTAAGAWTLGAAPKQAWHGHENKLSHGLAADSFGSLACR